jgi:anti-sigma regulatory factor (Ser/Thr protein kinase)/serine/threonine protein phosphatase PrpC
VATQLKTTVAGKVFLRVPLDCAIAQQTARQFTKDLGFTPVHSEEIVLAVAELASNVIRHAGQGAIAFSPLEWGGRIGIEVGAEDQGPGIEDIERSFADGYSSAGGLGYGLGTVNRLMDEVEITSKTGLGTRILCRRWIRSERPLLPFWNVGVATRSRGGAPENGDAFVIREWEGKLLAGVIDGLGHGEPAQKAALAAQTFVQTHYELPLDLIFVGASRACRATRGVVMTLAHFDSPTSLTLANLGNVEIRAWTGDEHIGFIVKRGILGTGLTKAAVTNHRWQPDWTLVLHSDGLHTHWQWSDFPGLEQAPAEAIAGKLLKELGKEDDDATVVTVKLRM